MQAIRTSHKIFIPDQMKKGDNLALRLSKFNSHMDCHGEHEQKNKMLEMLCSFSMNKEQQESYQYAFDRWKTLMQKRQDCLGFTIKSSTKCLLGMGNASVHEFGVSLNYPFGVPYIPGNTIKGLLSSYLARHGGDDWYKNAKDSKKSDLQVELFGGDIEQESKKNTYIGSVVFNDAWIEPLNDKWYVPDIINVHHQSYYAEKRFPDGIENPMPIKIAAMAPGQEFFVSIQGNDDAVKFLLPVLENALREEGIGSKTATGYGRFELNKSCDEILKVRQELIDKEIQEKEKNREFEKLTAQGKIISHLEDKLRVIKKPQIKLEINKELKEIEHDLSNWSVDDKQKLADFMENFFELTGWSEAGKTRKQKDKQEKKKKDRIKKIRG